MAKMNRREYLTLMGATGVALAASCVHREAERVPSGTSADATASTAKPEAPRIWKERWSKPFPTPEEFDPKQIVKLIFHGLASFTPTGAGCEVGFHSSGDTSHRHDLSVSAFHKEASGNCKIVYDSIKEHDQIGTIALAVDEPDDNFDEVFYFQPGEARKRTELADKLDFRWVIDFESDYFYRKYPGFPEKEKLPKFPHIYQPKFTVPYGLFYTLRKTKSIFELRSPDESYKSPLGSVADVIGANVYVKGNNKIILKINEVPHEVKTPGEIYFINPCKNPASGKHCQGKADSTDERERSDFYLHYKAINLEGRPKLELWRVGELPGPLPEAEVDCAPEKLRPPAIEKNPPDLEKRMSDESPCAGAGYSGGQ